MSRSASRNGRPPGDLYFVSDRTGWWNLYRAQTNRNRSALSDAKRSSDTLTGFSAPVSTTLHRKKPSSAVTPRNGRDYLAILDTDTETLRQIETPFTAISQVHCTGDRVIFIGASPTSSSSVVLWNLRARSMASSASDHATGEVDASYISEPQPIEFPTENGLTALRVFLSAEAS